jgi:DNA-binding NarL/FixJ family response regulator
MGYSILLIDDHKIITNGLKNQLKKSFPGSIIYEANTTNEAYSALHNNDVDFVVSDLSVDDYLSELELVERLKEINPEIKLIIFSMHAHASIIQSLVKKGIFGYVVKTSDSKEVTQAIRAAIEGKTYLCKNAGVALSQTESEEESTLIFTQREKQIIKLIVEGKKTNQIARTLRITANTVESHRKNIFKKTGTKNMAQLVKMALTLGIVDS